MENRIDCQAGRWVSKKAWKWGECGNVKVLI